MKIPQKWTFNSEEVAQNFDSHVREQLPWYDLVSESVSYIVRNYLPENGVVMDVGSSTGNIIDRLLPLIKERNCVINSVETSSAMLNALDKKYEKIPEVSVVNADLSYEGSLIMKSDVCIVFLTMMFIPVARRSAFIQNLKMGCSKGGAVIVVDKVLDHGGYFGTVMKRLGMHFKVMQGVSAQDVLDKEMSLAGVQIPIDPSLMADGKLFFRIGEFAGWVIET